MSKADQIYTDLHNKYDRQILKKEELAKEMGIGLSTLSKYLAAGIGIPPYTKISDAKNARIFFAIRDVADFFSRTIKVV